MSFEIVRTKIKQDLTGVSAQANNMLTCEPGFGAHLQLKQQAMSVAQELGQTLLDVSARNTFPSSDELASSVAYLDIELHALKEGLRTPSVSLHANPMSDFVDRLKLLCQAPGAVLVIDAKDQVLGDASKKVLQDILSRKSLGEGLNLDNVSVFVSTTAQSPAHGFASQCEEFVVPTPSLSEMVKIGRTLHAPALTVQSNKPSTP